MITLLRKEGMSRKGRAWDITVELEPRDCWVGVFWERHPREWQAWICLLPCVPVRIEVSW